MAEYGRTLDDLSDRLAAGLLGLGLSLGDGIASLMPNRPAVIVHHLACFKAGLVATPANLAPGQAWAGGAAG